MGFLDKLLGRSKQLADQGLEAGKKLAHEGKELADEAREKVSGHADAGAAPAEPAADEPPAADAPAV